MTSLPYDDPEPDDQTGSRWERRSKGGRRAVILVLAFFVLLVLLAVFALPLLSVRGNGEEARSQLTAALDALDDGDLDAARTSVTAARASADDASDAANGFRASVLGALPVAGGAVDDLRSIVVALDEAVSIAELGVQVYPDVIGDDASLVQGDTVDLSALASVTDVAAQVSGHLERAHTALDSVAGDTWLVGGLLADARDAALDQIVPLQTTLIRYQPVLDVLPSLLGTEGPRNYLVAVMNPAELRFSGGATLSLAPMSFDQGRLTFGDAGNTYDFTDSNESISWEPVPGNPWHTGGLLPLVNATFSPNWTTSSEELLRAWEATTGDRYDALIVIDLPAIASLFTITGPVEVPKYGALTAGNFVETLAGSYDKYPSAEQRRELNASIIPVLRSKLFEGGKFAQKAQALLAAGDQRRFVMYFRDAAAQSAIGNLGVAGDLSTTPNDYLGVFTQNTNASKVDYWQQRTVDSDVTVNADGSASVSLTVTFDNPTPPYTRPAVDPMRGYFTRWSQPVVGVYFPVGAQVETATVDGAPVDPALRAERDRSVSAVRVDMEPGSSHVLQYTYRVPSAALVSGSALDYSLDIDPQATVNPAHFQVTVHLPAGFQADDLPDGWSRAGTTYIYESDSDALQRLRLHAVPTG